MRGSLTWEDVRMDVRRAYALKYNMGKGDLREWGVVRVDRKGKKDNWRMCPVGLIFVWDEQEEPDESAMPEAWMERVHPETH